MNVQRNPVVISHYIEKSVSKCFAYPESTGVDLFKLKSERIPYGHNRIEGTSVTS